MLVVAADLNSSAVVHTTYSGDNRILTPPRITCYPRILSSAYTLRLHNVITIYNEPPPPLGPYPHPNPNPNPPPWTLSSNNNGQRTENTALRCTALVKVPPLRHAVSPVIQAQATAAYAVADGQVVVTSLVIATQALCTMSKS